MDEDQVLFDRLFLSVGAMKAGTTWIYTLLDRHPELFFTFEKEIHYFYARYVNDHPLQDHRRLENARNRYINFASNNFPVANARRRLRWAANYLDSPVDDLWYKNLFVYMQNQKYACDFSNLYALLPEDAWRHVSAKARELKVMYTLRDPAKRLWSHVKFHLQVINKSELLETWTPEEIYDFAKKPFMWENAEYGRALRTMKAVVADENLHVCFYEDIRTEPAEFLKKIEDFLRVENIEYPEDLIKRRVNESLPRPMPDFFPDLFKDDFERIAQELKDEGLSLPDTWTFR